MTKKWLEFAKKIKAISQIGLTYSKNNYDIQRYDELDQIAFQMFTEMGNLDQPQLAEIFLDDSGYATPKVDLRAGVFKEDEILLVRERSDQKWTLPGGWADVCESPKQGIEREVFEESGFKVKAKKCVAIIDRSLAEYEPEYPHHVYKILFLCKLMSGQARTSIETDAVGFFDPHNIPDLSKARVIERDIRLFFDHHAHPDLETYFE